MPSCIITATQKSFLLHKRVLLEHPWIPKWNNALQKDRTIQKREYPLRSESTGCIHNLSANSELTGRRNAGWCELSAFLGSFPEMPTVFTGIPGSKLFSQVFSAPEHYCELPTLEEVALAEMQSPQCSLSHYSKALKFFHSLLLGI